MKVPLTPPLSKPLESLYSGGIHEAFQRVSSHSRAFREKAEKAGKAGEAGEAGEARGAREAREVREAVKAERSKGFWDTLFIEKD